MHPIIAKTFGGLSKKYYFRQFFFGLILFALTTYVTLSIPNSSLVLRTIFGLISMLLYPYSRFVYENIVGFIMGKNMFVVNAFLMMSVKFGTMVICWFGAIFIAPIGLAYLYYHHSKINS